MKIKIHKLKKARQSPYYLPCVTTVSECSYEGELFLNSSYPGEAGFVYKAEYPKLRYLTNCLVIRIRLKDRTVYI